ncbi:MAG: indole-3-glycerol phosphate synthase [Rhodospirillales bacterium 70-18]|nr:indole-3-glycerol phosphate synthase TrpC [Rhodospirillales bacterium]OJY64253.1 MAG: indole-3-glycerol phosphate synthase [Rhodospirillales bacterium 70-18]
MPDVLARICADTRAEVARRKQDIPRSRLRTLVGRAPPPRGFAAALDAKVEAGGLGLIAEIKRASPSGGAIRPEFDPAALALAYQFGGAACLSVLTDLPYFQGTAEDLAAARAGCDLPVLRKDFMIDPWQIHESRAMGADCILLIMAVLEDGMAAELEEIAMGLGMDVLAESHDQAELERALRLKTRLIGINNRDLRVMQTDLATTEQLAPLVPPDRVIVSESGLKTHAELQRMATAGARRFLVGESLLRQPDLTAATRALLGA